MLACPCCRWSVNSHYERRENVTLIICSVFRVYNYFLKYSCNPRNLGGGQEFDQALTILLIYACHRLSVALQFNDTI